MDAKKYLFFMGGGSSAVVTAEYQAVLDFATANGITKPSPAQQVKENAKIAAYKVNGLWLTKDAIYNFWSDGSKEFCTLNWKNPALYQGTLGGDITWAPLSGFTGGTTGVFNSNFDLAANGVNYTTNDGGIIIHVSGGAAETIPLFTLIGDTSFFKVELYPKYQPDGKIYMDMNNAASESFSAAITDLIGLYQMYRNGAASLGAYKDGLSVASGVDVATGAPDACTVILFAKNNNNVISGPYSTLTVGSLEIGSNLVAKAATQNTIHTTFIS